MRNTTCIEVYLMLSCGCLIATVLGMGSMCGTTSAASTISPTSTPETPSTEVTEIAGPARASTRIVDQLSDQDFVSADFSFDAEVRKVPPGAIAGWKPKTSSFQRK